MRPIPNAFRVPAPFSSAWDFLRFPRGFPTRAGLHRTSGHGNRDAPASPTWSTELMARIAGVNIPTNKRVVIALQYIHGIGPKKAEEICEKVHIPAERRVAQLSDSEVLQIRDDRPRLSRRGRPSSRGGDQHQASDGPGRVSRPASSAAASRPRTAHAHQCAHPQGQGEAHRRQEEVIALRSTHFRN